MTCAEVRARLHAYVDGELTVSDITELDGHCVECRECAARVAAERELRQLLRRQPRDAAPPDLRSRILHRVRREAAVADRAPLAARAGARGGRDRGGAAAGGPHAAPAGRRTRGQAHRLRRARAAGRARHCGPARGGRLVQVAGRHAGDGAGLLASRHPPDGRASGGGATSDGPPTCCTRRDARSCRSSWSLRRRGRLTLPGRRVAYRDTSTSRTSTRDTGPSRGATGRPSTVSSRCWTIRRCSSAPIVARRAGATDAAVAHDVATDSRARDAGRAASRPRRRGGDAAYR